MKRETYLRLGRLLLLGLFLCGLTMLLFARSDQAQTMKWSYGSGGIFFDSPLAACQALVDYVREEPGYKAEIADNPNPEIKDCYYLDKKNNNKKEYLSFVYLAIAPDATPTPTPEPSPTPEPTPTPATPSEPPGSYTGVLRKQPVDLCGVGTQNFVYTKRERGEYERLRSVFDSRERAGFMRQLGTTMERELRAAGFGDADMALIKSGRVPQGWEVHHKRPLDDGGDNSFANLVLIKSDPYHYVLSNAQKQLVGDLPVGDSRKVDFPVPSGSIYPSRPATKPPCKQ
jgi:hypothetical protein